MNYYIIPKNNFNIELKLQLTNENIKPYISYSLIFYLNDIYTQLVKLNDNVTDLNEITIDYINKMVNPFEFIHTNVPGSIISVSKVKPDANIFFELMEVFQIFNINEIFSLRHKINIAHLTPNHSSTNYLLNMLREENDDTIVCEDFDYVILYNRFITNKFSHKIDLLICEFNPCDYTDTNKYIHNMLLVFLIVVKYQVPYGTCVIKIDNIFYKAIVDIIFILSCLYDRVYLVKPSISNITKGERYIICKSYNARGLDNEVEEKILNKLSKINNDDEIHIASFITNEIPYYFLNKLEESNAVIGQQQLEAYDQIINIFNNKNREEKMELLKRNHIQKCIQWCEKNQLPHNKFIDKINIFLATKKEEKTEHSEDEDEEHRKDKEHREDEEQEHRRDEEQEHRKDEEQEHRREVIV